MWFNQYITFFFTEHFKFISVCFEVLRGLLLKHHYNDLRERIHENWIFGCHFVLKWTRLPLTDRWISSEKGILYFSFTEISCPGHLKFVTDSLPLFELNKTFFYSDLRSISDVRRCHATWNERIHKESRFYTPEKTPQTLFKKLQCLKASICLFAIDKGNSCLFETCV